MAYTVAQVLVEGVSITEVKELKITCCPGEHATLKMGGYVEENQGEQVLYGLCEYAPLSVLIQEEGDAKKLFSGIITNVKVTGEGNVDYMELEARSNSLLMDVKKKSRSFQDVSMTYSQMVSIIMSEYPGSDIKLAIPDVPLGQVAIQYRETDWEFLKRMLSMLNGKLSCNQAAETIQLYAGIPEAVPEHWDYIMQKVKKEMGEYDYWIQEGAIVSDIDFLVYTVETERLPQLFDRIFCQEEAFIVRSIHCLLEKGMIHCICELQKQEGMLERKQYPMHLIGVALEGTIIDVAGEQVKIHMAIDDDGNSQDVYWFPFSTLSASPDGSGWYYMPEKGDQVRVYFASKYTKDVIAISAVSTYDGKSGGGPDKMGTPSTKSLSNAHGQEMSMGEDGINLQCKGGAASLKIGNDGSIALKAIGNVGINAENNVTITAETDIVLHGSEQVVLSSTMGGQVALNNDGNLYIQAVEVFVD